MVPIDAPQLEALLGHSLDEYSSVYLGDRGHGTIHPLNLLQIVLERGVRAELSPIQPVRDGPYKSGDIWVGPYGMIWFYFGKTPDGKKDILINLGGDTLDAGSVQLTDLCDPESEPACVPAMERLYPLPDL